MLTQLTGQGFPQWIRTARDGRLPGISPFALGLEQDLDAVTSSLTLPGTPAPSRAASTDKMIKRQMFGRAGLPLLRKRVLLTAKN
jgi:transposase